MKLVTILNSQNQLVYNSKSSPKWYVISKNHGVVCLEKKRQQFGAKVLWWISTHYLFKGPNRSFLCLPIGQVNKKRQQAGHSKKTVLANCLCWGMSFVPIPLGILLEFSSWWFQPI